MSEGPSVDDVLQVAQRALAKVNELEDDLEELEQDHAEATEDLTALKLRVEERDEDREYRDYGTDEKVGMVREHAYRKAVDGYGRTKLYYDDVEWEVFGGEPGSDHCYKLLRLAAADDEEDRDSMRDGVPGFAFRDPDSGQMHLAVDADLAERGAAFSSQNKAASAEGGR